MKTIFLLFTLIFISSNITAQPPKKTTYLVLSIRGAWDKKMQRDCYRIYADADNPYAAHIYNLVWFYSDKTPNKPASFIADKSDTATVFYNYFTNTTAALMFMAENGWELVTVNNEVSSDYDTHGGSPYTKVHSTALYYFKKTVESR